MRVVTYVSRPEKSFNSSDPRSVGEHFDWALRNAVNFYRLAIRHAAEGRLQATVNAYAWAQFYSGRVTLMASDRNATRRMISRSRLAYDVGTRAGRAVMAVLPVRGL